MQDKDVPASSPTSANSIAPLELSVHEVHKIRLSREDFYFLDCREPFEYEIASIHGATLIPMGQLAERIDELESYRQRRIVVVCHHGRRSLMVANALRSAGFEQAQSMEGGIDAWSLEIDPSIPRY